MGVHQFLIVIPDKPLRFSNAQLCRYGMPRLRLLAVGSGRRGFTIAGHSVQGRLRVISNETSDVAAAREFFNNSARWYRADWSTQTRRIRPVVNGKQVGDTRFILHILRRTANYIANERGANVQYGAFSNNCNRWMNTLLNSLGTGLDPQDFSGFDLEHATLLPLNLFARPTVTSGPRSAN